ncbi:unnamed protein product, partial [Mesorhabditis spiculigera]
MITNQLMPRTNDVAGESKTASPTLRDRRLSGDSGFSSQNALSDDESCPTRVDEVFAEDVSDEDGLQFASNLEVAARLSMSPQATDLKRAIAAMRLEYSKFTPTSLEEDLQIMLSRYEGLRNKLQDLTAVDYEQTVLLVQKLYNNGPTPLRLDFLELTQLVFHLCAAFRPNRMLRNQCAQYFCDAMTQMEEVLEAAISFEQLERLAQILQHCLQSFMFFTETLDPYYYAKGMRHLTRALYGFVYAVEGCTDFHEFLEQHTGRIEQLSYEVAFLFENFCHVFDTNEDAQRAFSSLRLIHEKRGSTHPWELLRMINKAIGSFSKMPEPISAAKLLQKLMGSIRSPFLEQTDERVVAEVQSNVEQALPGGFIAREEMIFNGVRVGSNVHVPWKIFLNQNGPVPEEATAGKSSSIAVSSTSQTPKPVTSVECWYIAPRKQQFIDSSSQQTPLKKLRLKPSFAYPLAKLPHFYNRTPCVYNS